MPVYNVEAYIGACLDSVLSQDFADFELLVVDDGSTDGSAVIASQYAHRDRRVRILRQANAGQGPARNLAVAKARGKYLTFIDSDDLVPQGSLSYLVASIQRSASDFAVAGVRRFGDGRTYRPSWTVVVHEHDRVGITIDDFPAALADVVTHHRIFRRRFWTENIGAFPSGVYEDHVPMVAAYLRSNRFDLLNRVVYDWRFRAEGTSTGQQKHNLANLTARIAVKAEARGLVWREGSPAVRAAWVGRVLDVDFPPYLDHALREDAEYRSTLSEVLAEYCALATSESLAYVRVQQKVRTFLGSRGAWADLEAAQRHFRERGSIPPTTIRDGRVVLADPLSGLLETELPPELLELGRSECRMQACAFRAEWVDPGRLQLTGWAVIRAIDLSHRSPRIEVALVPADGGKAVHVEVQLEPMPEATRWVNWPHGAFDKGGFRAVIDVGELSRLLSRSGEWRIRIRIEVDGVVREGGLHHAVAGGSASRSAIAANTLGDGLVAVPRFDPEHGLTISIVHAEVPTEDGGANAVAIRGMTVDDGLLGLDASGMTNHDVVELVKGDIAVVADTRVASRMGVPLMMLSPPSRPRALPSGVWKIRLRDRAVSLTVEPSFAQRLPVEILSPTHRVRFGLRGRQPEIKLAAPLADDEVDAYAQNLLRRTVLTADSPRETGSLLIADRDRLTSPMLDELAAYMRHVEAPRYWTVPDLAAPLPLDVVPLIEGSRAWYVKLSAVASIITAADLDRAFERRSHQRVVRVFEDPLPAVGRTAWWNTGWTPGRIADELARARDTWDAIVVPDRASGERYRRELDWDGPVLAAGSNMAERVVAVLLDDVH